MAEPEIDLLDAEKDADAGWQRQHERSAARSEAR
jgi:hypothetical protein